MTKGQMMRQQLFHLVSFSIKLCFVSITFCCFNPHLLMQNLVDIFHAKDNYSTIYSTRVTYG